METFLIFDVNKPIMSDHIIEVGKSNADAARKYAAKQYPNAKLKASGSNYVQISAQQYKVENGKPSILGWKRQTWFELITN